jgi:hypothetical protein
MKIRKSVCLLICLWVVVFSGCVTLDIREANHELADLYSAKAEAIKNDDAAQEATINDALAILARQAAEKSGDATLSTVNRISFSRTAATAAWQAGSNKVIQYSEVGQSLCNQDNNYGQAPRDCGMLLVVPDLAAMDELTARYNVINKRVEDGSNPPTQEEIEKLFYDIASRIDSLLKKRDTLKASSADPKLLEGLDQKTGKIFCRQLQETFGLIVQFAGTGSTAYRKAQCENYKLKVRLKKIGFSQKIAPCLPPGVPAVPEDCQ